MYPPLRGPNSGGGIRTPDTRIMIPLLISILTVKRNAVFLAVATVFSKIFQIILRNNIDALEMLRIITRVTRTTTKTKRKRKMKAKTWTVTATLNGEMVEYKGMELAEANNAAAELEKDGAQWIEYYREW